MIFDTPNNLSSMMKIVEYADTGTGGFGGILTLIVIGVGTFFYTTNFMPQNSLVIAFFVNLFAALFLRYLGFITDQVLFFAILLYMLSLVISKMISPANPQV